MPEATNHTTRALISEVLPEPAPAMTTAGPMRGGDRGDLLVGEVDVEERRRRLGPGQEPARRITHGDHLASVGLRRTGEREPAVAARAVRAWPGRPGAMVVTAWSRACLQRLVGLGRWRLWRCTLGPGSLAPPGMRSCTSSAADTDGVRLGRHRRPVVGTWPAAGWRPRRDAGRRRDMVLRSTTTRPSSSRSSRSRRPLRCTVRPATAKLVSTNSSSVDDHRRGHGRSWCHCRNRSMAAIASVALLVGLPRRGVPELAPDARRAPVTRALELAGKLLATPQRRRGRGALPRSRRGSAPDPLPAPDD